MKLRIVQRTRDRVVGATTRRLADGDVEFLAGPVEAAADEAPGILDECAAPRLVLQDFCPLPASLEWELGRRYWQTTGAEAFLGGGVPYRVTNDGNLARHAATLLFESLAARPPRLAGEEIRVLELGAGSGLFARFFLDAFRELCRQHGRDDYDRLVYFVTDRSERMRADLGRHGLLSGHDGRYRIEAADASAPDFGLQLAGAAANGGAEFHAIVLNYVLDCLPATVLKVAGGELSELHVRTSVARGVELATHSSLSAADILACARSHEPEERARLRALVPLFALEHDYRPVVRGQIAFAERALEVAGPDEGVVLHNYGAVTCLENALGLLAPGGFALINDYDDSPFDDYVQSYRHQRFAGSTAFGLNQTLLRTHFGSRTDCQWIETPADQRKLVSRLLARDPAPATVRAFRRHFSIAAHERLYAPVEQARELVKAGRPEAALGSFRQALRRQPWNWALLAEVAEFLLFTVRDYPAALKLAMAGLELNPISADLWNTRGDCQYYLGQVDAAHAAFRHALELHPDNLRARYNLSFTFARRHATADALRVIAEALALDRAGRYQERLLRQQTEILDQRARARDIEGRCLADRWLPADA